MDKGIFITDIQPGGIVKGLFCVSTKRLLETRNGAPYLAVTLVDRSGEIEGRVWDEAAAVGQLFDQGDYVLIRGEAQLFRDTVQLRLLEIQRISEEGIDPGLFLPRTAADIDALWTELNRIIKDIKTPIFATLLAGIFRDRKISRAFRQAPAAKRMHHAYIGGLLEHTVAVGRLADSICTRYPELDRDLLLAAALLHDIGKIEEFSFQRPPIDYSDRGRLLGHLELGTSLIDRFAADLGIEHTSEKMTALKHLVLSHHGQREFGAPVLPMMEEALVLHLLDDLDAKLNFVGRLREEISGPGYGWSEYQRVLERHFYVPGSSGTVEGLDEDKEPGEIPGGMDMAKRQPNLWTR